MALAMVEGVTEVGQKPLDYKYKFTIGTLVTDYAQYRDCVASFSRAGFGLDDCQFLYIDNSKFNSHSAYSGLNHILNHGEGEFIILCHQDVLLDFDKRVDLEKCLDELSAIDPNWAIAGNAGGVSSGELAIRVSDPHGADQKTHSFPQAALSVDENFIVLKSYSRLAFSADLGGFHLYGADLCVLADVQGHSSYVIDFHLRHLSAGNKSPSFFENEAAFAAKYGRAFASRWVQTTCTLVRLTGNPFGVLLQRRISQLAQAFLRRKSLLLDIIQFDAPRWLGKHIGPWGR